MSIRGFSCLLCLLLVAGLLAAFSPAQAQQEEKVDESFSAFGVAMGPGVTGVLEIHITRWTTEDERKALVETLVQEGQEKMLDVLRKQPETGWTRTQNARGMAGFPSVRIHYAYQFPEADGKRTVILMTDRSIRGAEALQQSRSMEYDVSGIVMELQTGDDGKEKGQGTLYVAAKLSWDADKNRMVVENYGQEPVRLPEINREK